MQSSVSGLKCQGIILAKERADWGTFGRRPTCGPENLEEDALRGLGRPAARFRVPRAEPPVCSLAGRPSWPPGGQHVCAAPSVRRPAREGSIS